MQILRFLAAVLWVSPTLALACPDFSGQYRIDDPGCVASGHFSLAIHGMENLNAALGDEINISQAGCQVLSFVNQGMDGVSSGSIDLSLAKWKRGKTAHYSKTHHHFTGSWTSLLEDHIERKGWTVGQDRDSNLVLSDSFKRANLFFLVLDTYENIHGSCVLTRIGVLP